MAVLKFAKPQETTHMPTLNDIYKLAASTDARLDAMEKKLDEVEGELRDGIRTLLATFAPKGD